MLAEPKCYTRKCKHFEGGGIWMKKLLKKVKWFIVKPFQMEFQGILLMVEISIIL